MLRKTIITATILAGFILGALAQTPEGIKARIKGLENNSEYMELLAREHALKHQSDSIQQRVTEFRREFRNDTVNRAARAVEILDIEERLFDLRDQLGEVSSRINLIEQEWILQHLNDNIADNTTDSVAPSVDTPITADTTLIAEVADTTSANLLYNEVFAREIEPEDLAAIRNGQSVEIGLESDVRKYLQNHNLLLDLKNRHSLADSASLASRLFEEFADVQEQNLELESHIESTWDSLFDNKSYTYNYLLDKLGNTSLRDSFNLVLNDISARVMDSDAPSSALLNYALQRHALTDYERAIARSLGLGKAVDSLTLSMESSDYESLTAMSPVGHIAERVFINFENITRHSTPVYSSRNPIPECEIYPKGTIYRILLGTFTTAQSPTIFRGAAPIYVQNIYGKYRYFAGGFPSDSTAFAAQSQCKEIGFRRPEVVVWVDGQYFNLSEEMDAEEGEESRRYRIIIESEEPLGEESLDQIKSATGGSDIVKIGNTYTIDNIEGYLNALRLKENIEAVCKIPARIDEIVK